MHFIWKGNVMTAKKENRKVRYTKMVLQDSLIELMKEKPISKITIKALCEKADINRSTFYAHYTDQFDLLRTIEDETISWLKEVAKSLIIETKQDEIMPILVSVMQYIADNSKHLQVLMSEQGDINFQKQLFMIIYEICGLNFTENSKNEPNNKELYFIFVVNGSVGVIRQWLKSGLSYSASEVASVIYELALPVRGRL